MDEEEGMKVYGVIHFDLIGGNPVPPTMRCQNAWVGEENERLGFVIRATGGGEISLIDFGIPPSSDGR